MRPVQASGRLSDSKTYSAAARLATRWMRVYTRGIDPRFAGDRASELTFELWEHAAAAERDRWSGARAAVSLVVRTAAGAPRDLRWGRSVARDQMLPATPIRLIGRRRRPRVWVPLQFGIRFDQTNGMIDEEDAMPRRSSTAGRDASTAEHDASAPEDTAFDAEGNAFGVQGG